MNRRSFLGLGVAAASGLALSKVALAGNSAAAATNAGLAGSIYYTKENPGRWSKKVAGHMPVAAKMGAGKAAKIKVTTPHEMKAHAHYIVKHVVYDENMKMLGEKMFDPTKDKAAVSEHTIGEYKGKLHIVSVCNKHDTWLSTITV